MKQAIKNIALAAMFIAGAFGQTKAQVADMGTYVKVNVYKFANNSDSLGMADGLLQKNKKANYVNLYSNGRWVKCVKRGKYLKADKAELCAELKAFDPKPAPKFRGPVRYAEPKPDYRSVYTEGGYKVVTEKWGGTWHTTTYRYGQPVSSSTYTEEY